MSLTKKQSKEFLTKLEKMGIDISKISKSMTDSKINETATNAIKLNVIYSVIGYLETKERITGINVKILKDVARDYEKRVRVKDNEKQN